MGSKTYSVLQNLVTPTLLQEKTLAQLVAILKSHFKPKPVIIAERFHFHSHSQAMRESIMKYLADLRCLLAHCSFGDHLEETLCNRLVCGLRSESIQKRLLPEAELTLTREDSCEGLMIRDQSKLPPKNVCVKFLYSIYEGQSLFVYLCMVLLRL